MMSSGEQVVTGDAFKLDTFESTLEQRVEGGEADNGGLYVPSR
jgi:hypothetical protein